MKKHHILIVEDCEEIAGFVAECLSLNGHHVSVARDRDDAMQFLQFHSIDIILLDYWMQGQIASVFLQHVRNTLPNARVVLMTAQFNAPAIASFLGVHGILPKPFSDEDLLSCVERMGDPEALRTEAVTA